MSSEWSSYRLGDIADVSWGDTKTTKSSYVDSGFPAYSASGQDGYLLHYDYDKAGVVLSAIGADCGRTWLANGKWSCIKNTIRIWSTSDQVTTEFIYLATRLKSFWPRRGSAQPFISQSDARELLIKVPSIGAQKSIWEVFSSLDDRIAVLRATNATLEAIARALFKSWFVDFDPVRAKMEGRVPEGMDEDTAALFPDSFDETELGEVPRGWLPSRLGSFIELTKGCSYKGEGLSEVDGAFMFNLGCFNTHRVYASDKLKRYTGEYKPRHAVEAGDLIIANTDMTQARDILGRPAFVPDGLEPGFISHHVYKITVLPEWESLAPFIRSFLYFALQQTGFRERAIGFATGTTVLALPAAAVLDSVTPFPSNELLTLFGLTVKPLFDTIANNECHSAVLTELRDTLLPRLIAGQINLESESKETANEQ